VTKPFAMDELLARLRALSRRSGSGEEPPQVAIGQYVVDLANRVVTGPPTYDGDAATVRLTPTEWKLLEILVRHPGKLVSKRQLLTAVWGPAHTRESSYLRVYMGQLRRKLEPDPARPRHLLTESGMGYRFSP
jgi:two-component system KDP operon response regulator KdpE